MRSPNHGLLELHGCMSLLKHWKSISPTANITITRTVSDAGPVHNAPRDMTILFSTIHFVISASIHPRIWYGTGSRTEYSRKLQLWLACFPWMVTSIHTVRHPAICGSRGCALHVIITHRVVSAELHPPSATPLVATRIGIRIDASCRFCTRLSSMERSVGLVDGYVTARTFRKLQPTSHPP
jgi:hypothetical protein